MPQCHALLTHDFREDGAQPCTVPIGSVFGELYPGVFRSVGRLLLLTYRQIEAKNQWVYCGHINTTMSPPCSNVPQGHSLERQHAGFDTNLASDFVDNATPSPGYGLPSATPTPTPTLSPTPSITPYPSPTIAPATAPTPAPDFTPGLTPAPNLTVSPSVSQAPPWIHTKMPAFLFLIGLTLLATVFWLKKQG